MAIAAAAGPSSLSVWAGGILVMFLPLAACVVELSSRHPDEGGLYVWSKKAFGPFAGFLTGWTYWCSNLPYFPGVLYFAAGNALYLHGGLRALSASSAYYIGFSIFGLALALVVNIVGLDVGKWLNNMGALSRWAATLGLIGLGLTATLTLGAATPITAASLLPGLSLKDLLFYSAIAFALTGPEAASFMGDEVQDARRTIPRGLLIAAPMIAAIYVLGTLAVMATLPAGEVTGLQGVMQAVDRAGARLGLAWVAPLGAVLLTLTALGSVGAWLEAVARIPFVAGLDKHLPAAFGRIHPRWGTPVNALLTQALLTVVFVVMGQAGTSVRGAYEVLVSMTFLVTLIPFLFVFSAAIKLSAQPRDDDGWRVPGGRPVLVLLASIGLVTTLATIVLSAIPAPDEPNKPLAMLKVVGGTLALLAAGVVTYVAGRRNTPTATPLP